MQEAADFLLARVHAVVNWGESTLAGKTSTVPSRAIRRQYQPGNLFDVARSFARRVPLTRVAEVDADVRPYLAALMVAAMYRAGQPLVVPDNLALQRVTKEQFEEYLTSLAGTSYENWGALGGMVPRAPEPFDPEAVE